VGAMAARERRGQVVPFKGGARVQFMIYSMRRLVVTVMLALLFVSPAAAASIYVTNNSSLPDAEITDALPAFQRALDQDFAPDWREVIGSITASQ
jgi:hypothetical protein